MSYDTVKAWSHGRSQPTPANRMALACFGGRHAAELRTIAERLKEGESQPAEDTAADIEAHRDEIRRALAGG